MDVDFDILLFEDGETPSQFVRSENHPQSGSPVIKLEHDNASDVEDEDVTPGFGVRQYAMNRIEEWVLENLMEICSDKNSWSFNITSRRKQTRSATSAPKRRLLWPRKGCNTMRTIAQAHKVAELTHQALRDNIPITKRDIFYTNVPLFGKQSIVDTLVDDLAATWGLRRADLNIRAALKGLFLGSSLSIHLRHGETVRGLDREGALIPVGEDIVKIEVRENCQWVLVVEKEAAFQTLAQLNFAAKHKDVGVGIIITGKGYPDLATRQLVALLSAELSDHIPILALVDADPHGLEILGTYKFGSKSMAHENDWLVAPRIEWIGVNLEDIEDLGISASKMIEITPGDRRKATSMLENSYLLEEYVAQLERMLDIGLKAEIEVVSEAGNSDLGATGGSRALDQYVHDKIAAALERAKEAIKLESSPTPPGSPLVKEEPLDMDLCDF